MSTVQKVAVIIAATGLVTALVLPGRQTVGIITAGGKLVNNWEKTSITGK